MRTWLCRLISGRHLWKKQVSATHHRDSSDTSPRKMIRDNLAGRIRAVQVSSTSHGRVQSIRRTRCTRRAISETHCCQHLCLNGKPLLLCLFFFFLTLASPSHHCESSFHLQSWTRCFSAPPMGRKWILWTLVFSGPPAFVRC